MSSSSQPLLEDIEALVPQIRQVADFVGRRMGLSLEEREDLASETCLKLIDDDRRRLRQFRGEAKFSTYLRVLVTRVATDWIRQQRGNFRPAVKTRQRGEWACRYELLRRNEGHTPDEAVAILEQEGVSIPADQLDSLEAEIVRRLPPRRFESAEQLVTWPASNPDPESLTLAQESASERQRLLAALSRVLLELTPENRAFLRLYIAPNAKSRAARLAVMFAMTVPQVYRHYRALCKDLNKRLDALGVGADDASALLTEWSDNWESDPGEPSLVEEGHSTEHG
ncbi:MAG: sigma-70 family RNA polymerase sigma factor [Acidobacteriota bacterium]